MVVAFSAVNSFQILSPRPNTGLPMGQACSQRAPQRVAGGPVGGKRGGIGAPVRRKLQLSLPGVAHGRIRSIPGARMAPGAYSTKPAPVAPPGKISS
jgi:hypothetical protein